MPTGKIRWFDAGKGYGFITGDSGEDVFLPAAALPASSPNPKRGTKVEFSMADGRKGPQALDVRILEPVLSVVKANRPAPDDMTAIVEDLIKMLDAAGNDLRRHHYPSASESKKLANLLRAVAQSFDVQD